MITQHFNSRPHGGRQGNTSVFHAGRHFNSRPHGGRRSSKLPHTGQKSFQLTPSRRATGRNAESGGSCNNFNSRPHGGRRFFKREINARFQFQLTPSRRATSELCNRAVSKLFQLTPSRRATAVSRTVLVLSAYFNSRPHGGRLVCIPEQFSFDCISTHALTEGDCIFDFLSKI